MTCYWVVRRKYADLSGEGARLYGGRFNPPGIPAVYSSKNIALALLEILVHVDKSEVPPGYVVMAIRFAGRSVSRPARADLPGMGQLTAAPEADGFDVSVEWAEPLNFDSRLFSFVGR